MVGVEPSSTFGASLPIHSVQHLRPAIARLALAGGELKGESCSGGLVPINLKISGQETDYGRWATGSQESWGTLSSVA